MSGMPTPVIRSHRMGDASLSNGTNICLKRNVKGY